MAGCLLAESVRQPGQEQLFDRPGHVSVRKRSEAHRKASFVAAIA